LEAALKKALITGVTGQDGSYLAELLIERGYAVYGLVRRSSTFNTQRIDHLIELDGSRYFEWDRADLSDSDSLLRALRKVKPDEVYHLGAQSHVKVSFEIPIYTFDIVATGSLRLFEAIKTLGLGCRVYNACSSEMFGDSPPPQSEATALRPRSPYAIAKVASYHITSNYREAYGMPISNGILFNHESPRRGETFVTRKITRAVSRIAFGLQDRVVLGNLQSRRDWGYAPEFVRAMWLMLQHERADDFVIATGQSHTVREFVERAFGHIGVGIGWEGSGHMEKGVVAEVSPSPYEEQMWSRRGETVVEVSEEFLRPTEVEHLEGDCSKARAALGWQPETDFESLTGIMMAADLKTTRMLLEGTRQCNEQWRQYIV
jgi:GDPmannose 4,6-dehydratase